MANPFPGMNPFLESPARWPSFHQRFITYLADAIDPLLPANYSADFGERNYVTTPPKGMYPDIFVVRHTRKRKEAGRATAILEADPAVEVELSAEEVREPFIEIRMGGEPGTLVTVIELLSPANKTPGDGRSLYRGKQEQVLASRVHLMEIDLLRAGQHTAAIPREALPANGWDYLVCLHRGDWRARARDRFHYWAIALGDRLPRVNVPLAGEDADVVVDMQAVVDRCLATATGRRIDYTRDCPPPLSKKQARWVDELLRKRKLRK